MEVGRGCGTHARHAPHPTPHTAQLCSPTRFLCVCCCNLLSLQIKLNSPRQRVVQRVERDGRRDALHAEPPDVVVGEEAEADLLHRMADDGPVVRHDDQSNRITLLADCCCAAVAPAVL